jgi:membrane fusion protein, copper/silver efflux system
MKTAIITAVLFFSLSSSTISAQGNNHNSDSFSAEFAELIGIYLELKDALVGSDAETAISAASQMQEQLEGIGEHRLEGDAHMKWMDHYSKIDAQLAAVTSASDLEEVRARFYDLSETLIEGVKSFGIEGVVYHQHCPMAFNNEGGSWLSSKVQIQNPYMPDTMPGCGRVIERIEI